MFRRYHSKTGQTGNTVCQRINYITLYLFNTRYTRYLISLFVLLNCLEQHPEKSVGLTDKAICSQQVKKLDPLSKSLVCITPLINSPQKTSQEVGVILRGFDQEKEIHRYLKSLVKLEITLQPISTNQHTVKDSFSFADWAKTYKYNIEITFFFNMRSSCMCFH